LAGDRTELLKLIGYIDLTTLAGDDNGKRVVALTDRALNPFQGAQCAAVCVYPARVADIKRHLQSLGKVFPIASVAGGFPSGQYLLETRLQEIKLAVRDGATEIDTVINRAAALDQDWKLVHDEIAAMKEAAGKAHLKTILATGELQTTANIYRASWAAILAGSDFIKTSTGKESVNATLNVSTVMCRAIKRHFELTGHRVGFKPAGGIRTVEEALSYRVLIERELGLEWLDNKLFRIGASSLLDSIIAAL